MLNHIKRFLKLISILFTLLFVSTNIYAEEKFIGFIESLDGDAFKLVDKKKVKLNQFDQIFTNDEIAISPSSNATISFLDNSILTLSGGSKFNVKEFDNLSQNPKFIMLVSEGKFTFESGTIAKNKNGNMKINLSEMEVGLNGTLISGFNSGEIKQVSLVEDSMGRVGTLNITVGDQTTTVTNPSTGISLSGNNEIQQTNLSDDETNQIKNFIKEATVDASTETEEDINRAVAKQLAAGTIPDANGDGITDANDMDLYKAQLFEFKGTRMGYYMEMSSGNDFGLMSDMIRYSDPSQSMQLMQGMMEYDPANAAMMMKEVSKEGFDVFSHISNASNVTGNMAYKGSDANFEDVRASIIDGMMQNQSEDSVDTMAMVMAVSDSSMNSYLINEITNFSGNDPDNNLSMDVLASFTEIASEKMTELYQQDPTMIDMLTTSAFENATEEDLGTMSTMVQNSTGGNTAMIMQSMVEYNPEMVATVYEDLSSQDFDLFNHMETGKNQADPTMFVDPNIALEQPTTFEDPAFEDPAFGDPAMQFFDDLKEEIFTEIVNNSEGTAAEITSELMMNTSGDNAMFMMETVMYDNPELVGQVMSSFAEEEFDIFEHFEEIAPVETEPFNTVEINDSSDQERIKLTKEERKIAKAEKKAAKKEERRLAKAEKKAAKKAAKLLAKQSGIVSEEITTEDTFMEEEMYGMQNFKAQIFTEMITYADESTMNTMAQIVATGDAETSALVFESVIQQPSMTETATGIYGPETGGMALEFLDNLNKMDSTAIGSMFEENSDLMGDVLESALSSATSNDADAVSNIISSSTNDAMSSIMFQNVSDNNDQSFMGEVFINVAADAPELLMAMAETNLSLYEDLAQDVDPATTAASLMTSISNTENDNYTTATTDTAATTNVSTNTKKPTMMRPSPSNPYQLDSSMSGIYVYADSNPYTNGVTISATGLPPGVYFNSWSSGGEISGTPSAIGTYQVSVTATDMMDPSKSRTRTFPIKVKENVAGGSGTGPTWDYTPNAPSTLTKDTQISDIYLYASGSGAITYTHQNLPMGLYITSYGSSYVITGTPTMVNASPSDVIITATDDNGSSTTSIYFPMVSNSGGGTGPTWSNTYPPTTLTNGTPISDIYLYASGTGTVTYSDDGFLPSGLILTNEIISGTPDADSNTPQTVVFTATDDNGSTTESVTFPAVTSSGGGGPDWTSTVASIRPATLTVGTAFSKTLSATGTGTLSYTGDSNLTALDLSVSSSGIISGTPQTTTAVETTVIFTVTDDTGSSTLTVNFPMVDDDGGGDTNVTWGASLSGFPTTLTENALMTSFDLSNSVNNEPTPVVYTVSSGSLPSGLILTGSTVSGTPDTDNAFTTAVTFQVKKTGSATNLALINVTFPVVDDDGGGDTNVTWGASLSGFPTTLTENALMTSFDLLDSISDAPTNRTFTVVGTKPTWLQLTLDSSTGKVSGTPTIAKATETAVTFKVVEDGNNSNSATITVNFPIIDPASETVTFTTAEALGTKPGGAEIGPINIEATASLGSPITYNLNTSAGFINLSGNQISGIAPRLLNQVSYTVTGTATAGGITNSRTFTILIAASTPCMSPVANVCS